MPKNNCSYLSKQMAEKQVDKMRKDATLGDCWGGDTTNVCLVPKEVCAI